MVCLGNLPYNMVSMESSYPLVIMFKSCGILSAIVVGVCCSRVRDEGLKLGPNKLAVGALVSLGIILFNHYTIEEKGEKGITMVGLMLMLSSMTADGLLPDFQAELKAVYKPRPVDLMFQINKWVFWFSLAFSIVAGQFGKIVMFAWDHP